MIRQGLPALSLLGKDPMTLVRVTAGLIVATLVAAAAAAMAPAAQAAAPAWKLLTYTGPTNMKHYGHRQAVSVRAGSGTFKLTFDGSTTTDLPFDASAAEVEDALNALPSISGSGNTVRVYAGRGGPNTGSGAEHGDRPYQIEFASGPLASTEVGPIAGAHGATPLSGGLNGETFITTEVAPSGRLVVYPTNVGGAASSGTITAMIGPLPAGYETAGDASGIGWSCPATGGGQTTVTCTTTVPVGALLAASPLSVPLRASSTAPAQTIAPVSVSGGGAVGVATVDASMLIAPGDAEPGVTAFWAGAFDEDGQAFTQAGGHPASAGSFFVVNTRHAKSGSILPAGDPRDVVVDIPAGFVGNPLVTDRCPVNRVGGCSPLETYVGHATPLTQVFPAGTEGGANPVSNDMPPNGYAAQLTFAIVDGKGSVLASVRSDSDYGVTATAPQIPSYWYIFGSLVFLDGTPEDADGKAFLTNQTDCSGSPVTTFISASAWQNPFVFSDPVGSDSPPVTGCELVPFDPEMDLQSTSTTADSASGLDVDLSLPQESLIDPDAIATSHLKKTVVQLPEGVSVNPSAAAGLEGCSDAQIGLHSKAEPSCPDASKLGTVSVTSPLVDQPLEGEMYLGAPKSTDPTSGDMLRLFLVVRNERYGLLVKLAGSTVADPATGRLTATFDNNPRVPFDHLQVRLRGGDRGVLAQSPRCGNPGWSSALTPWSVAHNPSASGPVVGGEFGVDQDCDYGFAPSLDAGTSTAAARKGGTFSFEVTRPQGDQWVNGLTTELPKGLLATVKDVPLCSNAQADAGSCPASSRIGLVDASAGSGDPFVLEQKGEVFLTEGYKGGPYGLAVKIRPIAGPFRGDMELSPIVVRQKIEVDPTTAQVRAVSDPFPTVWHGVPLRVRRVLVQVDRPGFMLNPSGCDAKQVKASLTSVEGTVANTANHFQATGCSSLPFEPTLALRLSGRKQVTTGKHHGVKAQVTQQGVGEAGIDKVVVRLPKSLALDPNNAQALCEFEAGTKPDLENHCPKGSIVGWARAVTPLLNQPLAGNVYFVKNVRRDPDTGNLIRTLPMIIVALRGEIALNLRGESSTTKAGKLVNTFASVPDGPISQFNLNIRGGHNGILAVTRTRRAKINLCAGRHIAEVDNDGQNGRRHDRDVRMKTPCTKKQTKNAKRAAKRAAAKARAGSKRR